MTTYTEKHREYYLKNRERIIAWQREKEKEWLKTPKGIFSVQKRKAKQRGIEWQLSFDQWWELWEKSGKWNERGVDGYAMCRYSDTGSYSVDNIRIDTFKNNSLENYEIMGIDNKGRFQKKPIVKYE
jgi:hypothetical protein